MPDVTIRVPPLKDTQILGPFDPVLKAHLDGKLKIVCLVVHISELLLIWQYLIDLAEHRMR